MQIGEYVMRISALSPAKTILFGEHYVVYGAKGIAAAIGQYNEMDVELAGSDEPSLEYISTKKENCLKKDAKDCQEESSHPIEAVYLHLLKKIPALAKYKVKAKVKKCWPLKGVGNSASLSGAFAYAIRALMQKEDLKYAKGGLGINEPNKKILFEDVQIAENAAHGKGRASGIDAGAIVHGKIILYEKTFDEKMPKIIPVDINMPKRYCFLLIDTSGGCNEKAATAMQIEKFAKSKKIEKKPAEMAQNERKDICKEYEKIGKEALDALKSGDAQKLGECMKKNHEMLRESDVSCPLIEKAGQICNDKGALGAKLTGAGGEGGAVIALVEKKNVGKIKKALEKNKFKAYEFFISEKGVHGK